MEVYEAIFGRRSIRQFTDEPIEDATLEKLLDAARWAPNSSNRNAWRFVVITSDSAKRQILRFAPGISDRPAAIIVICIEPQEEIMNESKRLTFMADAAIAAENICLAAHAEGIGTCMVASFADIALRPLLSLPEDVSPYITLALGYPDEDPEPPDRLSLEEIAFREEYGQEWSL